MTHDYLRIYALCGIAIVVLLVLLLVALSLVFRELHLLRTGKDSVVTIGKRARLVSYGDRGR